MRIVQHFRAFHFALEQGYKTGNCDVLVYGPNSDIANPANIVIATEPITYEGQYLNSGMTVSNAVESIALLLHKQGYRWQYFIDHLPARSFQPELFALVSFAEAPSMHGQFAFPDWKRVDREDVGRAINGLFPDWHNQTPGLPPWGKVIAPL